MGCIHNICDQSRDLRAQFKYLIHAIRYGSTVYVNDTSIRWWDIYAKPRQQDVHQVVATRIDTGDVLDLG